MKALAACLMLALCGCVNVTATRTVNGVTESIHVKSFLSTISNGSYTNGSGLGLTVTSATPDQQTIGILAGSVVTLATLAKTAAPTNSPAK